MALELEKRRKKYLDLYKDFIGNEYSSLDPETDARLTSLIEPIETLTNLEIGLMNISDLTQDPKWINNYPFDLQNPNSTNARDSHGMFFKIAFIHIYFSIIESSLRILLRNIDSKACNNATAEFKSIYETLFKRLNLKQYIPLLDLLRCIRNTIHNNGVFMPISNKDEHINYKGKKYDFLVGKPQMNSSWNDLLFYIDENIEMIEAILKNQTIIKLPQVTDPFTSSIWPIYKSTNKNVSAPK